MNKSLLKFVTDFGPLAIFLYIYYSSGKDIKVALIPFIVATIIALAIVWFLEKRVPLVPLFGGILITLFGGLTIYFNNPIFIYVKPTIINIIFALILILGKKFFQKNFLKTLLQNSIQLSEEGWDKLNLRWSLFFIFLAILNELVWRTQTEAVWVNFKVWGILPLTFFFTALQIPLINKFKI